MNAETASRDDEPWWVGGAFRRPPDEQPADDEPATSDAPDLPLVDAYEDARDGHTQSRDEDEPRPSELPGGADFEACWAEAAAFAANDRHELWNRLTDDERTLIATNAAIRRRQRREVSFARTSPSEGMKPGAFMTAREFMAIAPPAVEWLAEPWIARGALHELVGRAKAAGKTTFLGFMCRAIVDGTRFLGGPTAATPIVYLTEQTPTTLRALLARTDLGRRDDFVVRLWSQSRLKRWPDQVAEAVDECERRGAGLLVVDTLPQFAGIRGDAENDAGAALAAIEPLQAAAADGRAVIVVRHERKGGGDVGDSGRGSTAFTGAVDVVLQLTRPPNAVRPTIRKLAALSRFDETPEDLLVELTEDGYVALGTSSSVALDEAIAAALEAIPAEGDGIPRSTLEAELGMKGTTLWAALSALLDRGDIERRGAGKRGDAYRYRRFHSFDSFAPSGHGRRRNTNDGSVGSRMASEIGASE